MATVGLDHDSHGFHAVCFGGGPPWVTFRSEAKDPDSRRIESCHAARAFFKRLPPRSWVFAEEPLALKNGKTTRVLGLAAGALWAQTMGLDLFWTWVDTATWKREVVGKGSADKEEIARWITAGQGLPKPRAEAYQKVPDLYDAHCLAMYGVRQRQTEAA